MPIRSLAPLGVVVCLAIPTILHAQKGKPPRPEPVDIPGVAWLASDGRGAPVQAPIDWEIPGEDACQSLPPGAFNGDLDQAGNPLPYVGNIATGEGAYLRALDKEFVFTVRATTGRHVYLYFTEPDPTSSPADPRKEFCAVALDEFQFHTHVLRADGSDDIALGLTDIAAGATHPARILSTFVIDGITYQIRFNGDHYPGSTNVRVTRGSIDKFDPELPDSNWWRIETGVDPLAPKSGDIAQLLSPARTKRGNPGPNDEGRYFLPFKIVFTTDLTSVP